MMWVAHAGEEHGTNNESIGHLLTGDFIKIVIVSAVFISIIIFLAYASQRTTTAKQKKEQEPNE